MEEQLKKNSQYSLYEEPSKTLKICRRYRIRPNKLLPVTKGRRGEKVHNRSSIKNLIIVKPLIKNIRKIVNN